MSEKSTEIAELKKKVRLLQERARLLQEIVELKERIAELEDNLVRYSFRYRCELYPFCNPYPNGTLWLPDTWSGTATYGDVLVANN